MKTIGHFLNQLLSQLRRKEVFYFSVLKICKRQRNLWKKKVLKAEDVKNLPPVEEIHGLNIPPIEEIHGLGNPTQAVKVNSLYIYDKVETPSTKFASQCLDEFDDFMARQENFNAYVGRQLKQNAYMIGHLSDYMARVKGELKLISKHASMVTTQVDQVLKAQMICSMN